MSHCLGNAPMRTSGIPQPGQGTGPLGVSQQEFQGALRQGSRVAPAHIPIADLVIKILS